MKPDEEYQGWSNSRTWSAAFLVGQEREAYEALSAIRMSGRQVTGDDVKYWFNRLNLKHETWVSGRVNWQEIADDKYNKEDFIGDIKDVKEEFI